MRQYRNRAGGFTLVEILIVVIILGILAAIVIPQFTNASQDARKNSLTSQLQTIRGQLELAKLQHRDVVSASLTTGGATAWDQLTTKTNDDYTTTGTPNFGPYLNASPVNSLNGGTATVVIASGAEPTFGASVSGGSTSTGWVYHVPTGKIFATTKSGTKVYNEADGLNADQ
ncbi:MAG TPA: type II secretion system protein [Tepidisphaeraceae bacterium]|nr:type II secretion system protein [Tepidisphaeraceae bacterium]